MKSIISAFVVALGLIGCSDGSSSSKDAIPAPAANENTNKKETSKQVSDPAKLANIPTKPIVVPTEPVVVPSEPVIVPTEAPVVNPPDAKAPVLAAEIQAVRGRFFDAKFHAMGVSRSLEIDGNRYVSIVRGLARGTMSIVAVQREEGSVVVDESGAVKLVAEKSTCDDSPDFAKAGARLASFSNLKIEDGSLTFTFMPLDTERKGALAQVDMFTIPALNDSQVERDACWYINGKSLLATFIDTGKALPASL